MSRFNRRTSRMLIAVLVVALASGVTVALHGLGGNKPAAPAPAAQEAPPVSDQQLSRIVDAEPIPTRIPVAPPVTPPSTPPVTDLPVISVAEHQPPSTQPVYLSGGSIHDQLADAKTKQDAGKLVEARAGLNAAAASRRPGRRRRQGNQIDDIAKSIKPWFFRRRALPRIPMKIRASCRKAGRSWPVATI